MGSRSRSPERSRGAGAPPPPTAATRRDPGRELAEGTPLGTATPPTWAPHRPVVTGGTTLDSPPLAAAGPARALPDRIASFVIGDHLGAGGMGTVYAAVDERLGREVAIKVVRTDRALRDAGTRRSERRLLAEAQALARLAHPNVVTIYEVGPLPDGGVFVAMELVRGEALRSWARSRPWRDVLAMYLGAGRGLAAAHRAGIVHRDFKPDNVMIGADGRPRVVDFGLAVPATSSEEISGSGVRPPSGEAQTVPAMSQAGIAGTPGYMAPEQCQGRAVDARTDQFAFCVALSEALHGERPYLDGTFFQEPAQWPRGRQPRPSRPDDGHPRWLDDVLERGLATDPAQRFPSMEALLAALDRDSRRRPRPALAAALAAVVVGASALGAAMVRGDDDPCPSPASRLRGVWDPATRAVVANALGRSALPWVSGAGEALVGALDRQAGAWIDSRIAVCRATHVEHVQSPALLDRRIECLEARHRELAAAAALAHDQPLAAAERVEELTATLGPVDGCLAPLADGLPSPPASEAERVAAARTELATAAARRATGDLRGARAALDRAAEHDRGVYPPLGAEREAAEVRQLLEAGAYGPAAERGERAALTALAAGHDTLLAALWLDLAVDLAGRSDHLAAAERYLASAEALRVRLGESSAPARVLASLARGRMLLTRGRGLDAVAVLSGALAESEMLPIAHHALAARILHNRANAWWRAGQNDRATADYRHSLEVARARLGAEHPKLGRAHRDLAVHLIESGGDLAIAEQELAAGRRIARSHDESSVDVAVCELVAAQLAMYRGDSRTALARAETARALLDRQADADGASRTSSRRAEAFILIGAQRFLLGDPAAALVAYREAHGIYQAAGASPVDLATADANLAEAALALGDVELALASARNAAEVLGAWPSHATAAVFARKVEGQAALRAGRPAEAVTALELAVARGAASAPGEQADALWSLAQARHASRAPIPERRAAAEQALQHYRDLGDSQRAGQIRRWLRALR
jgi:tRNA A-37 threonylcarbamoyl transferase component Bud32/tetratricopeptide (TPR) repeat protein